MINLDHGTISVLDVIDLSKDGAARKLDKRFYAVANLDRAEIGE